MLVRRLAAYQRSPERQTLSSLLCGAPQTHPTVDYGASFQLTKTSNMTQSDGGDSNVITVYLAQPDMDELKARTHAIPRHLPSVAPKRSARGSHV